MNRINRFLLHPVAIAETSPGCIQKTDGRRQTLILVMVITMLGAAFPVTAGERSNDTRERRHSPTQPLQSQEDIERRKRDRTLRRETSLQNLEFRTIDGSNNNLGNPDWGRADIEFIRLTYSDYSDGVGTPSGELRPGPREISNAVVAQPDLMPNDARVSDFVWQWGQFLDHDINLTPTISPVESFDISMPPGDSFFDPQGTGETMPLDRSLYTVTNSVRQQLNLITSYIDASNVYGSNLGLAMELRTLDGTGRLKMSAGKLLPFNPANPALFIAGDSRANEQVGLTAMHTLFVREHNYWADRFRSEDHHLSGEQIYQMARSMVAAEMQKITYDEFLPVVMGPDTFTPYQGYQPGVNPTIANEFSTASYRFGHSMISPRLLRLDRDNRPIAAGHLPLRNAFFNPGEIINNGGIEPLLRGLAAQRPQQIDVHIVDDLRNFLFGAPGAGGFDLASLNIQRGRDHGLPPYNEVRRRMGLSAAESFADISSDPEVQANLGSVYNSVEDVDLWVGGLAEDHVPGALIGETIHAILKNQFERLRNGDRFWYQIYLPQHLLAEVENLTLADIIRRNTRIKDEIQDKVFIAADAQNRNRDNRDGRRNRRQDSH